MSSPSNDFTYAKQFDGNLRANSQPVPVKVTTRLRVMSDQNGAEIRRSDSHASDTAPAYVFGAGSLAVHPNLQAVGRHYFRW